MVEKHVRILFITMAVSASLFIACKNEVATKTSQGTEEDAIEELEESLKALKDGNGEVVSTDVLKKALPEKMMGMKRVSHNARSSGIAGINFSSAEAEYEDGDRKMKIGLVDTGGFGAVLSSMASWSEVHVDNQTADGYERTMAIDGNKAFEKYDYKKKRGEIAMISDDRFIFSLDAENLSEKEMRKVITKIKIRP